MMLWDEVTVRSRLTGDQRPDDMTVPAHVYTVSGTNPEYPYRPGMMVHSLRAIIGPDTPRAVDPVNDDVIHKGTAYRIDGPPMGRYRRGQVHHWTINPERITGRTLTARTPPRPPRGAARSSPRPCAAGCTASRQRPHPWSPSTGW